MKTALQDRTAPAFGGKELPMAGVTCAVQLIDRRTGRVHKINGRPLVFFTRRPEEAVAEVLAGRDARVWEVRVEPLTEEGRV